MATFSEDCIESRVEHTDLHQPSSQDVVKALTDGLKQNFEMVSVSVEDCPDLTKDPFRLTAQGLCGSPKLVELGGAPYLLPVIDRSKLYDCSRLGKICSVDPAFVIGAGAGPWPSVGRNCEMVANLKMEEGKDTVVGTRIVKVIENQREKFQVDTLPQNETRCALLANLFLCEGKPGKVFKIHCKKRTGDKDFVTTMREGLKERFGPNPVGLGGVFLVKEGNVKQHVMPDFSTAPINTDKELNEWLCFYEMSAPLIALGTFVSGDPGLDLRVQHFHSFGFHGEGGHYHYDTTPDSIEYVAYLSLAEEVWRIDRPEHTHQFGRD